MPEAGHFIIALSIIIPVFYLTEGKFNKKVAVLFVLSNWIGPDHGQIFSNLFNLKQITGLNFHWFIPFLLWAIPLAYCYSYISRFSVKRTERFFTIADDGKRDVNWKNAYLVCISGGLLHTIADAYFRHNVYDSTIKILDGVIEPKIGELHQISSLGIDIGVTHVIFTYFIAIFVVFSLLYLLDKDFKKIFSFFIVYIAIVFMITVGFLSEEYDAAVIILSVTFIVIPLMLLFYVDKNVRNNPTHINTSPRFKVETGLKIVILLSLLFSAVLLVGGLVLAINPSLLDSLEIGEGFIVILGLLLIIVGSLLLSGVIGLLLRKNFGRIVIIVSMGALLLLIYPLFILGYLSQDDVKSLFKKEQGVENRRKKKN